MNATTLAHWRKKKLVKYLPFALSGLALLAVVVYSSWRATYYFSNIQDNLLYPYLFQHFRFHDIIVPAGHANILKFPLFWLQSLLPYNFLTLSLADVGLSALSIIWWAALLVKIFGKRYLPLICTILGAILFAAVSFHINFLETTVRNVEYPIGLSFILVVNDIFSRKYFTKKVLAVYAAIGLLFAASLAGDNFILFAFTVPLLLALAIYWFQTGKINRRLLLAGGAVVIATLAGLILRKLTALLGIESFFASPMFSFRAAPASSLGPSISHASTQLMDLSGANVFGRPISPTNVLYFVNFALLVTGVVGLVYLLIDTFRGYYHKKSIETDDRFALGVLAFSFFTTFCAYVFSNLVVIRLADGRYTDAYQSRYITLLPLILVVGVIALLRRFYPKRKDITVVVIIALVLAALLAIPSVRRNWRDWDTFGKASRQTVMNIVNAAEQNNVKTIVTADSLGAPTRFWSHNKVQYVSIIGCTNRFPYNTRRSWGDYTNSGNTALVIDQTGLGTSYWSGCSLDNIRNFYGQPEKTISLPNPQGTQPITMWIYPNDIRSKLAPLP